MVTDPLRIVAVPVDGDPFAQDNKKIVAVPVAGNPFEQGRPDSSAGGAFLHAAERNVVPAAGGVAGFGAGATAAGIASAPLEGTNFLIPGSGVVLHGLATLGGGLLGAFGGSWAAGKAQDAITSRVPDRIKATIGQDAAQQQADAQQHPYSSLAGELAPNLLFMRPSTKALDVAENAPGWVKALAHPAGGAAAGAALSTAPEAYREASVGQIDPARLALFAGAGVLTNRPTRLGEAVFRGAGQRVVDAAMAGARGAGRAWGNLRPEPVPEPDFESMKNVTPAAPKRLVAVPVEGDPFAAPAKEPVLAAAGEAQPGAPPRPPVVSSKPSAKIAPGEGEHIVTAPNGDQIAARFEVVPAASLTHASGDLQNRARSRETSDLQVQNIVSNFEPSWLGHDNMSDRGAPIVGPDNVVESGNGRMAAINRVYAEQPEKAQAYRDFIESQGHSIEGVENPVLIRRRTTDMTPEQVRRFVVASNKDTKLELSPSERALSDADNITPDLIEKYAGGDLNSTANRGFVEGFNKSLTSGEMGNMVGPDRRLTQAGKQRIENAIVARAYGNPKVLERMMESPKDDIRAITGSMADVAAPWAKLRHAVSAGEVAPEYDITDRLAEAAAKVSDARKNDTKPSDILAQRDAFNPIDPITEKLIRAFYNPEMMRAASRKSVTDFLHAYTREAQAQTTTEGLFGAEPPKSPGDIINGLLELRGHDTGSLLEAPPERPSVGDLADALDARLAKRKAERTARQQEMVHDAERTPVGNEGGHPEQAEKQPVRSSGGAEVSDAGQVARGEREGASIGGEEQGQPDRAAGSGDRSKGGSGAREKMTEEGPPDYSAGRPIEDRALKSFDDASFTQRASIYSTAAHALGIDPDKFTLMPAPRQVALLRQAMTEKFGVEIIVDKGMQERFAIDQMLDAFQNVQGMAHVLDLPAKGISLDGALKLKLQKVGKFLGAYQPGAALIMLPRRSNSFAHEWGHALDYHLLAKMGRDDGKGLTGLIRSRGTGAVGDPTSVKEAFADLLNAMFFDHAAVAREIMALEAKIQTSTSAKVKADAQAQIDRMKAGNSQKQGTRSEYYRNAKSFDAKTGNDYWTSPTEMFARAFEAYVSYKAETEGLTTEFIGKGDAEYLSAAEERFAKTFPKGEERLAIFATLEKLFGNIADEAMLGKPGSPRPESGQVHRITDFDKTPAVKRETNIIQRELGAIKRDRARTKKEVADRADNPKGFRERVADLNANAFFSMASNLRMIQARSKSSALQTLIDLLTKQDGRGDRTVARTFGEDVHLQGNMSLNRLSNILRAHQLDSLDADEDRVLRDLLIGAREDGPDNFVKGAAALRRLMDNEFYVNQKAGIDLGYTRNGYLARVLDMPKVYHAEDTFVAQATKVYEIVFDKQFGDPDAVLSDDEKAADFMKAARRLARMGHDLPSLDGVRKMMRSIKRLGGDMKTSDEPDQVQGKVDELSGQLTETFGDLYDEAKAAFARQSAEDWLAAIHLSVGEDRNLGQPDSRYTNHRELPPETDKIMEQFFLSDPVESIANYLKASARRTAYARRFGAKGEKRDELFEAMAAQGVSAADRVVVAKILDTATGRTRSNWTQSIENAAAGVAAYTQMSLLPRAMLSSLAEPFTAGLVTGNALDGFKMMGNMISAAFKSPSGRARFELARAMGIIADSSASHIMQARYGQSYANETRWDRATHAMYKKTGLTGLTNAQKSAAIGVSHAFLDRLSRIVTGAAKRASKEDVNNAVALLREFGIRDPEAFAKEMGHRASMPTVEDLDSDFGHDYATAQLRLSTMMIQEPGMMDRPLISTDPVLRICFGIFGFSMGYWRNIIKRNGILLADTFKNNGQRGGRAKAAIYASYLFAAAATAYVMQTVISMLREKLLNPKRWDDLEKSGELWPTMLELGATRTFSFGLGDTVIQAATGLKYRRDLSNVAVGAGPATILQNTQKIAQPITNNSRKTNTAEFSAAQGAYSLASPFLNFGLARLPGGPLTEAATGVAMGYATSPAARDTFAGAIVGPKNGSVVDGRKVKSGPSRYDRFLNEAFGPAQKKTRSGTIH